MERELASDSSSLPVVLRCRTTCWSAAPMVGWRLLLVGWRLLLVGWRLLLVGWSTRRRRKWKWESGSVKAASKKNENSSYK
uniref:Putative ovule protein n=1 Tax=Solanum chacoense TaxID=4108 RepID=A0A0V0GTI1_SOLCH